MEHNGMARHSELRHDLVSGNWVLLSTRRGTRPHELKGGPKRKSTPISRCPFERPFRDRSPIYLAGPKSDWRLAVVANKYPAVIHGTQPVRSEHSGFYEPVKGSGHHELILTHSHYDNFPHLSSEDAQGVFHLFQERYRDLAKEKEVAYISMFHNWGPAAGASVFHPHYQILTVPIVPSYVERALQTSEAYFRKHQRFVHDVLMNYELKKRKRIVFENKEAVVLAPYVSREPFELRVYPKRHNAYFEDAVPEELAGTAAALQTALTKLEKKLHDPDYNFLIHTASVAGKARHHHYKWHIEIIPKLNVDAGFELGTGIEINTVDPDDAAKILRN
jgi:UDPglucose--hexose-1-phosphate uridylyltransferase